VIAERVFGVRPHDPCPRVELASGRPRNPDAEAPSDGDQDGDRQDHQGTNSGGTQVPAHRPLSDGCSARVHHRPMRALAPLVFVSIATLLGCAATPTVTRSRFDGAKEVAIEPRTNDCSLGGGTCTGLGAQWNSGHPSDALLIVSIHGESKAITGAELSIDGEKHELSPTETPTHFSQGPFSEKSFSTRLGLVRKIAASRRTWIRVHTTSGYCENAVVDGETESPAFVGLKRFLAAVDQY
jgi:hypothetical protein